MKYKRVYEILRKRKQKVSGFSYVDRSCWGKEDYTARLTPLWICVEDTSIGYRLWITQTSASALHISYVKIDAQGKRDGTEKHIRCRSKIELADRLERLFSVLDAAAAKSGRKRGKAA
jgi:hypothetical protein